MLTIGFNEMVEDLAYGDTLTVLHGSTELEPCLDVAIGDNITANARIAKIRERQGQMGATLFITVESNCVNQNNEKVAMCRQVAIVY
jgi:hydroxyacyl-ACP dehydratase HTD2-like protein with hotdog domain